MKDLLSARVTILFYLHSFALYKYDLVSSFIIRNPSDVFTCGDKVTLLMCSIISVYYSYRKQEEKPRHLGQFGTRLLGGKCERFLQSENNTKNFENVSNSTSLFRGKPSSVSSSLGFIAPYDRRDPTNQSIIATKTSSAPRKADPTDRPKSTSKGSGRNPAQTVSSAGSLIQTDSDRFNRPSSETRQPTKCNAQLSAQTDTRTRTNNTLYRGKFKGYSTTDYRLSRETRNVTSTFVTDFICCYVVMLLMCSTFSFPMDNSANVVSLRWRRCKTLRRDWRLNLHRCHLGTALPV